MRHLVSVLPDEIGVGMLQIDLQVLRGPPVQLALLKAVHSQVAEHRFVAVVNPAIQKQRSVVLILGKGQRIAGVDIHHVLDDLVDHVQVQGEHSLILCLLGVPRRICGLLHIAEILQTELTEGGQRLARLFSRTAYAMWNTRQRPNCT